MLTFAKRILKARTPQDVFLSENLREMGDSRSGRTRTPLSLLSKVRPKPHTCHAGPLNLRCHVSTLNCSCCNVVVDPYMLRGVMVRQTPPCSGLVNVFVSMRLLVCESYPALLHSHSLRAHR